MPIRFHRSVAFLDPPAPEHLPRGVVTWPLFAAAALAHVVHVLSSDPTTLGFVITVALAAQVVSLVIASLTVRRLFATGATRARVVRIIVIGALASVSAIVTARSATSTLRVLEIASAVLALAIVARAALGWKQAV